jgi:hypothetical protein
METLLSAASPEASTYNRKPARVQTQPCPMCSPLCFQPRDDAANSNYYGESRKIPVFETGASPLGHLSWCDTKTSEIGRITELLFSQIARLDSKKLVSISPQTSASSPPWTSGE